MINVTFNNDPDPHFNTVLTLNPAADRLLLPLMQEHFEIELLQGEVLQLPNGQTRYKFNLCDTKSEALIKSINRVAFKGDPCEN